MAKLGRVAAATVSGLLVGGANALELSARQRFDEKMEKLRQANRTAERAEDRNFQREIEGERQFQTLARDTQQLKAQEARDDKRDASENARLDKTIGAQNARSQAEQGAATARNTATQGQMIERKDGSLVWAFPDGTTKPVMDGDKPLQGKPVKPGADKAMDPNLLSADEDRTIRNFEDQFKDAAGRVDRNKVIAQLARTNKTLAEKYAGETVSADGLTLSEAKKKAAAEAEGKKGYLKSRASEFSQDGGDETKFIERRTAELMGSQPGKAKTEPGSAMAAEPKPGESAQPAGKPAGEGTPAKPYTAATQADIDWFKTNAPAGAVIIVNGTPYTK